MIDVDERAISASPAELSVDIGFPTGQYVPWQTAMSIAKTIKACTERGIGCGVACIAGSSVITWARNKVLDTFLAGTAKHLFWIDSDIVWEPGDFIRILALASKYGVVCGVYPQKTPEKTIVLRHPNLCEFEVNAHGLVKVEGAGLGFTCISREVAQRLSDTKPKVYDPAAQKSMANVFRLGTIDRGHECEDCLHEDVAFFADVMSLGYDVWLDPSIQLGHMGSEEHRSDPMKALRLTEALEAVA